MTNLFQFARVRGLAAAAGALVVLLGVLLGAGCYKPKVKSGGLLCNADFLPECPDGLTCDKASNTCVSGAVVVAPDASADRPPDMRPDMRIDVAADRPPDMSIEAAPDVPVACLMPVAGCTPDPKNVKCDPQCQTGCGCHEKCLVTSAGNLTCNQQAGTLLRTEGQSCVPVSEGMAQQTDDCAPGLVCFAEPCGHLCARYCRVDADCPGASVCSRALPGGFKGCDFPSSDCNPVKNLGDMKCPVADEGCYLSATIADRTVCDCPAGSQGNGESCNSSRDCLPGLTCADPTGGLELLCHPACALTGTVSGCPGAQLCHSFKGSVKFGVCN